MTELIYLHYFKYAYMRKKSKIWRNDVLSRFVHQQNEGGGHWIPWYSMEDQRALDRWADDHHQVLGTRMCLSRHLRTSIHHVASESFRWARWDYWRMFSNFSDLNEFLDDAVHESTKRIENWASRRIYLYSFYWLKIALPVQPHVYR